MTTIAVVFAGGVGTRMANPDLPKQLMEVAGKPILIYTLERFQQHAEVDQIYLVVAPDRASTISQLVQEHGISKISAVVEGGSTAHESIFNGLKEAVNSGVSRDAVVLIHDGVRPILPGSLITKNIKNVLEFGSAITAVPAYETVGISRDARTIESVPERSEMYALQAPQSFRLGKIYDVNSSAADDGKTGHFVDQAHMMNQYSHPVHLVEGLRGNVKITVPEDYQYFSYLVETGMYERLLEWDR